MNIHQARDRVIELIKEGTALDPTDFTRFDHWVESSYKALEPFSFSQLQFDKYCRSSTDSPKMRAYIGVHLLKLATGGVKH
jgi:hypothetical protein